MSLAAGSEGCLSKARNAKRSARSLRESRVLDAFGHHRELAEAEVFDVVARHDLFAVAGHAEDDPLIVVFDNQAGQVAAVFGDHGDDLIRGSDDEAGVEHVGNELLERRAAVGA